ncbi:hypothetical protein ANANG_G00034650 [Anguilla anguilla]|uniref:Uncharacterized protein n=1 Tax=Anguilla anguilla TaxID=7936 RepID=A0A9D3S492_ANGAN|nr:hypothetical protein ANANG_G00034650 [Anguilla anguilla]
MFPCCGRSVVAETLQFCQRHRGRDRRLHRQHAQLRKRRDPEVSPRLGGAGPPARDADARVAGGAEPGRPDTAGPSRGGAHQRAQRAVQAALRLPLRHLRPRQRQTRHSAAAQPAPRQPARPRAPARRRGGEEDLSPAPAEPAVPRLAWACPARFHPSQTVTQLSDPSLPEAASAARPSDLGETLGSVCLKPTVTSELVGSFT